MKVYLATDHAGFELKEIVKDYLMKEGDVSEVVDFGALAYDEQDDYPDFISLAAEAIAEDLSGADRAIIFGGSGQGEAMVANRTEGVRATVYYGGSQEIVTLGREHNNANVLSLGAGFVDADQARTVIDLFLTTDFSEDERHKRRLEKF